MSVVKDLMTEGGFDSRHDYVEHERRRAENLIKSHGFGKASHNKDATGAWTHSEFRHDTLPHDVIVSKAYHPKTGQPYLNIRYTKKEHTHIKNNEDLGMFLSKAAHPHKHWWSK